MHASREWSSVCTLLIKAGASRSISPVWRYEEWKQRHAASLIRCWHIWCHQPHYQSSWSLHPHLHLHCTTREERNFETVSEPPKGKVGVPPKSCFIKVHSERPSLLCDSQLIGVMVFIDCSLVCYSSGSIPHHHTHERRAYQGSAAGRVTLRS